MLAAGVIDTPGISGPASSLQYAAALYGNTLGDTLISQANLLVESNLVKIRAASGVAGLDEVQISHDLTNGKIETMDGDLLLRTPLNKSVRIRPATSSGGNPLLVCEDAAGAVRLLFDLFGYRLSVGGDFNSGVSIDGVTGDFTTKLNADIRAASFARFYLTGCRIRWPTFMPTAQLDLATAGWLQIYDATTGRASLNLLNLSSTGYIELTEASAPSNPSANSARVLARDNGAGKTEIYALFADGSEDQIALQP